MTLTAQSEIGQIRSLLVKAPSAAFVSDDSIAAQWQTLNYLGQPDLAAAKTEYQAFIALLDDQDIEIHYLPDDDQTGMDSIYVRDASIICDQGAILCSMGKPERIGEPDACARLFQNSFQNNPAAVHGRIRPPGSIEGGDVAWLDEKTLVVGRGYRTNDAGIAQLRALLPEDIELVIVPLPHWRGPDDVFHLMSMLSPIDDDLLLVYSPLLPVPFRELLIARGFELIDVAEQEFDSMGCNVLTIAPRRCVIPDHASRPLARRSVFIGERKSAAKAVVVLPV
jgi:N-dimethylarginine dimethylaminohydrolase